MRDNNNSSYLKLVTFVLYILVNVYICYISFSHPNKLRRKLKLVEIKLLAQRHILSQSVSCSSDSVGLMVKHLLFNSIQFPSPTSTKGHGSLLCKSIDSHMAWEKAYIDNSNITTTNTHTSGAQTLLNFRITWDWKFFSFFFFKSQCPGYS